MSNDICFDIEDIGASGDGVGVFEGRKIFVPYSLPGEKVTARLLKSTKEQGRAALVNYQQASPLRQTPPCPHFTRCGGCNLQHIEQEAYYAFKQKLLNTALRRSGFADERVWPLVRIGAGSRRRASFKIAMDGPEVMLGFFEEQSHRVSDINECLVLESAISSLIRPLKKMLASLHVVSSIQEINIALSDTGLDMLFSGDEVPELHDIEQLGAFAEAHNIARMSWIGQSQLLPIVSQRPVEIVLGEVRIEMPVGSFQQASRVGQETITNAVLAALKDASSVVDLYAGCGTYSFPLAAHAKVHAVEGSRAMVAAVKKAATRCGYAGKVTVEGRDIYASPLKGAELKQYDAAVINPPRNGASSQVLALAASAVPVIVMVSCNPATFARDARILKEANYRLTSALGVDQFLFSHHLEMVAVFSKV